MMIRLLAAWKLGVTLTDFLRHWSLTENPFRGEEARSDPVFNRMSGANAAPSAARAAESGQMPLDLGTFHSDFEKIIGDLRRPASSVVFGEKGSGKTAIRLQIARRIADHNAANPGAKVLLVAYDDLNGDDWKSALVAIHSTSQPDAICRVL